MWNKDTSNQHKQVRVEGGAGQVLPRNYKQEPVVLRSDPGHYEKVHNKYLIWMYWVEECECWFSDYVLTRDGLEYIADKGMTPIMQDNVNHEDIHISTGIDERLDRAEDFLDEIISGRI